MSKLINQLAGSSDASEPAASKPLQLELLGPLPVSVKDPPSVTAPVPPRANPLARPRNRVSAESAVSPEEMDKWRQAVAESETRMEALRLEIVSLQDSRDAERRSRLAGEERIRELEGQLHSAARGESGESSETRQALDEAQTQLDDLRSQFRHLEGHHGEQAHKAEQRVRELMSVLEREQRELQAARSEIERLRAEAEEAGKNEGLEEDLIQARLRVEELETRLCSEAEIRGRAERLAGELQSGLEETRQALDQLRQDQARQTEAGEHRLREAEQQTRQAQAERDAAQDAARKAHVLREQEAARFQERERLAAQRMAAMRRVESPAAARLPARALSTLPLPWPAFVILVLIACSGAFLLGRWQAGGRETLASDRLPSAAAPAADSAPLVLTPPAPKPIEWPAIKASFLRIQPAADRMTLVFEYAVFSRRTEIHPDALRDLQKLARQLAPYADRFRLEITGHTDADPVSAKAGEYASNLDLGLKRAQVARDVLIRQGGLPAEMITTVSAGEANPPYPNTSPELRKKNRTVTLALIRK